MFGIRIPSFLLRDTISIQRYAGAGAEGDTYHSPGEEGVRAHIEPRRRLVTGPTGESNVMADATCYIRPEVAPVPPGSIVVWGGVPYRVAAAGAVPSEARPAYRELILTRGGV